MTPKTVHIDRLEIDLRGVPPAVARAAVAGLGPAIAAALSGPGSTAREGGSVPPSASGAPLTAAGLQAAIAAQVAGAIAPALVARHERGAGPDPST